MKPLSTSVLFGAALLTLASGLSTPVMAADPLTISQEPLYVTNRIKPAFIMAVDDSGSMTFETSFPAEEQAFWNTNELTTPTVNGFFSAPGVLRTSGRGLYYHVIPNGIRLDYRDGSLRTNESPRNAIPPLDLFGFARSPDFNVQWFDPDVIYSPWARADGSSLPNATFTAARSDPRADGSAGTRGPNPSVVYDFSQNVTDTRNFMAFRVQPGMVIPSGTRVQIPSARHANGCGGLGATAATRDVWITLNNNHTVTAANQLATSNRGGGCEVFFEYFPAVVFRTVDKDPPRGFDLTKRVLVPNAGGNGVALYKYELRPANFLSVDDYNAVTRNFANWYTYYGNRTRATIAGMTRALSNVFFMRAGYFSINRPTDVTMRDLAQESTSRASFYDQIVTLPADGGTPNRSASMQMIRQFNRTGTNAPVLLACQINAGMLFTDGFTNQDTNSDLSSYSADLRGFGPVVGNVDGDDGSPFADTHSNTIADIARYGYETRLRTDLPAGLVQVRPECEDPNPSPRLNCNRDLHMNFHGVVLGLQGDEWKRPTPPAQPRDPFNTPAPVWTATGTTNLLPSNIDDIWHGAVNSYGTFTSARNPLDVTRAMQNVINAVLDSTQPAGTPGVAGARVGSGSATYATTFNVRNNGRDWFGNVESFRINADGSTGAQLWSAESRLPAAAERNILAARTAGDSTTRVVGPFVPGTFGSTPVEQAEALGITLTAFNATFTNGTTVAQAYDYLRGDQTREQSPSNQLGFRSRSGRIGSIINSPAEVETKRTSYRAFEALPGTEGEAYLAYLDQKAENFTSTVFVGTNAGMLHAFRAGENAADTNGGRELFAYVPNGALRQMGQLLYQNYQHRYFVDGELNATDAMVNGSWRTVLLGNMGRGGKSVFALDVTDPANFSATNVLWELPTTDADLGLASGRVEVMYGEDGRWYAVFANGLNSTNSNPGLFIVNLSTGSVTRKIMADDGGDFANGLVRIALADTNANGRVDAVYGGDYQGNLWKFNLAANNATAWNVAFGGLPLFRATDVDDNPQPITGGVSASNGPSGGVMVHFGTGSYLTDTDAVAGGPVQRQTFYGVWDRPGGSGEISRSRLQQQTITGQFGTAPDLGRTISNNRVDYRSGPSGKDGWFIDLFLDTDKGERFIGEARVIGDTITFPTSQPSSDSVCTPGLTSWGYRLDRFSGAPVLNRMERPGGSPVCATEGCGALQVRDRGAPVTGSSIIQPQRPCRRGIDPECPAITDPAVIQAACGSPNPADATYSETYDQCVENQTAGGNEALVCSISNPIGNQDFGGEPQVCGRQSWRQVR